MRIHFNNYLIDTDSYEILVDGQKQDVEPQVFAVLQTLIENRHRVVTKDELINTVWQGRIMSDAAISSRIKSARKAIGDSGRAQEKIKTVHGIGFRFIAEVNCDVVVADEAVTTKPVRTEPVSTEPEPEPDGVIDQRPSIVVLPFTLAANTPPSIFPQGLAHDIIAGLSRLRWLKVISRSSAFQVDSGASNLDELRALTQLRYCLSGSIDLARNTIIVHYELLDMPANAVILADRCTLSIDEIHEFRFGLTKKLISKLELQISEHEAQRACLKPPENLDAWEAYHLAMSHLYRFTAIDNQKAVDYFTKAIQREPGFARAYAGLSAAEFQNAFNLYPGVDSAGSIKAAIDNAERSIELDKLDPLANFVMGRTYWLKEGETAYSLPWLDRTLALNPNYAHGYYAHGLASLMTSSDNRGYDSSVQAISLSPLDPFLYGFYGIKAFSFLADADFGQARIWAEKAAIQPEAIVVMDILAAAACELDGDSQSAQRWLQTARKRHSAISSSYFFRALPFSHGVIKERIMQALKKLGL